MVRVSVVWLNYNSMNFIDIALRSLESFLNLDFNDYELIVVDNASTDGSFERIRKFIEGHKPSSVRVRIIRNDRNLGYAGGMNIGWETRDPDSKYVAFANNDLIPTPESLAKMIEHMEGDEKIAATSGLTYIDYRSKIINSVGGYGNEIWRFGLICNKLRFDECYGIDKPHYVTYADGSYMVVRVDAVKNSCPWGQPFISETFLYLDDNLLGLILWNRGYRIMYVPFETGIHYGGKTTGITESKITMGFYYMTRNYPILSKIIFTKYYKLRNLILNELIYSSYALCKAIDGKFCFYIYGFKHGEKLVKIIMPKIGTKLSLYRAPYIKVNLNELTSYILMYGYLGFHKVIPSMLSYDSIIE